MGIIVSKNARGAQRLEPSGFPDEAYLQDYITRNPTVLPFDELDGGDRFLVLAREVETASGPIDAVGIDGEGNVYLIETKLFRNPDKRHVLAQVLDYGAALWKHHGDRLSFRDSLSAAAQRTFPEDDLTDRIAAAFGLAGDAVSALLDSADLAAQEGRFRFIVLMDRVDDRLKTLITFINQNSSFDVLAVETEFYRFDDVEITIPRLHGAIPRKAVGSSAGRRTRAWDEASFFETLAGKVSVQQAEAVRRLYDFFRSHADTVRFGSGAHDGSFLPTYKAIGPRSAVTVYTFGSLTLNFAWCFENGELHPAMARFAAELRKRCPELPVPESLSAAYPTLRIEQWAPCVDRIIAAVAATLPGRSGSAEVHGE